MKSKLAPRRRKMPHAWREDRCVRAGVSSRGPEHSSVGTVRQSKGELARVREIGLKLVMWVQRVMAQQLWIILYLPGATCPAWGSRKS